MVVFTFLAFSCKPKKFNDNESSEISGTIIQFCPPFQTPLERTLWLSLVEHYVPKKLFNNYMSCSKKPIKLTSQEMADIHPQIEWGYSQDANAGIKAFQNKSAPAKKGIKSRELSYNLLATARGGTLGAFTIHFTGHMEYLYPQENVLLVGKFWYEDYWDFDVQQSSQRERTAEARTAVAAKFMSGKSFPITSEIVTGVISYDERTVKLDQWQPKTEEPRYSERGLWLINRMREAQKKHFSLGDVLTMLMESQQKLPK